METIWEKLCSILQKTLKSGDYKVWIAPLQGRIEGNKVYMVAASSYVCTWIQRCFADKVRQAASDVLGIQATDIELIFSVCEAMLNKAAMQGGDETVQDKSLSTKKAQGVALRADHVQESGVGYGVQMSLPITNQSPLTKVNWRHDFDDFVVGPTNAVAVAAAHDICRNAGYIETLFVSAPSGLGKTHLIHAIGQNLAKDDRAPRVGYLTAEDFTSHFVRASRNSQMDYFKACLRDLDVLLLEDVHLLQGKEKTQNEALATIKSLQTKGKRVVLTSSFSPKDLQKVDNQLVSHFCSGLLTCIDKPTKEMCRSILRQKADSNGIRLPSAVEDILVEHLQDDVRKLESCLKNLHFKSQHLNCDLNLEMAMKVLSQFMPMTNLLDIERIIALVCNSFKLNEQQLVSRSRKQEYVLARDTVYYLARKHTNSTLEEIGKRFNRRHSTVVKGISTIERQLQSQNSVGRQVAHTLSLVERNAGM